MASMNRKERPTRRSSRDDYEEYRAMKDALKRMGRTPEEMLEAAEAVYDGPPAEEVVDHPLDLDFNE